MKIGIHGRNDVVYRQIDLDYIRDMKFQSIKMMSHTHIDIFKKIYENNKDIEIITRLYDPRISTNTHPTSREYIDFVTPIIERLSLYCKAFQITNEPNHIHRYEGWGSNDDDARNFNGWYIEVFKQLKRNFPNIDFIFPGLALPDFLHRDRSWLNICRPSIEMSDRLGCHVYWQTDYNKNIYGLKLEDFGRNYEYYHKMFPDKIIDILECGNSNCQNNIPISEEQINNEYIEFINTVKEHSYINSINFFILSSPDKTWNGFTFVEESGKTKYNNLRNIIKNNIINTPIKIKESTKKDFDVEMNDKQFINQQVINSIKTMSIKLNISDWNLLSILGLDINILANNRSSIYEDSNIDRYNLIKFITFYNK